jgi:hypothetical protein
MHIHNVNISPNGENLILNIEIPEFPGYEDLSISKIAIQDHLNYTIGYPEDPQFEMNPSQETPYIIDTEKKVIKFLNLDNIFKSSKLKNTGLFYIYIYQEGIPGAALPCAEGLQYYIVPVLNAAPIYKYTVKLIKDAMGKCDTINKEAIIDVYWKKLALRKAIEFEDYIVVQELYDSLFYNDFLKKEYTKNCDYNTKGLPSNNPCNPCI